MTADSMRTMTLRRRVFLTVMVFGLTAVAVGS
jgi:hypothetical protein